MAGPGPTRGQPLSYEARLSNTQPSLGDLPGLGEGLYSGFSTGTRHIPAFLYTRKIKDWQSLHIFNFVPMI